MMEPIVKYQKSTLTIFGTTDQSPMPGFYDKMREILKSRTQIVGLEQWKRANTLHVHTFTVHAPLTDFGHFKRVFALFGSVDWEDLDSLRKTFLSDPETKILFEIYLRRLNGKNEWRESLGPPINEDDGEPEWHFSNRRVLRSNRL